MMELCIGFWLISSSQPHICSSLTNESLDCQTQSQDILFDLHKKVIWLANGDEIEVIHMGRWELYSLDKSIIVDF